MDVWHVVLLVVVFSQSIFLWKVAHDSRTGLWARWAYDLNYPRLYQSGGWVIMIDMNDLKGVNDRFGHGVGDRMIREVAHAIRRAAGAETYQWGGDEVAVLKGPVTPEGIEQLADQIRTEVSLVILRAHPLQGGELETIKGSVAIGMGHSQQAADVAMYADKANYKNHNH